MKLQLAKGFSVGFLPKRFLVFPIDQARDFDFPILQAAAFDGSVTVAIRWDEKVDPRSRMALS